MRSGDNWADEGAGVRSIGVSQKVGVSGITVDSGVVGENKLGVTSGSFISRLFGDNIQCTFQCSRIGQRCCSKNWRRQSVHSA